MISPLIITSVLLCFFSLYSPTIVFLAMASPTLITPTTPASIKPKLTTTAAASAATQPPPTTTTTTSIFTRRSLTSTALLAAIIASPTLVITPIAEAASDEEYIKETQEVINKVRNTITLDKKDPNVVDAVADLRATSNSWVAKYRREKALLGRSSFRDIYSALNAVSGHYISFGPTAPIPAKRRVRILEEMDTAEKALLRGR